jgi:hypothetical protein
MPNSIDGAWRHRTDLSFPDIARLIQSSIESLSKGDRSVVQNEQSLQELLRQLYDYVLDTTAVPHWRNQIEYNDARVVGGLTGTWLAEMESRQAFLHWRIEQALLTSDLKIALRQLQALERLRRMFGCWCRHEPFLEPGTKIVEVNWELLQAAGDGWRQLVHYNDSLHELRHAERDDERIRLLWDLKPDMLFIGRLGFSGYIVFIFNRGNIAVLESAFVGNALYIMPAEEWRDLSKLSKTELLERPRPGVERLIHSEGGIARKIRKRLARAGVT